MTISVPAEPIWPTPGTIADMGSGLGVVVPEAVVPAALMAPFVGVMNTGVGAGCFKCKGGGTPAAPWTPPLGSPAAWCGRGGSWADPGACPPGDTAKPENMSAAAETFPVADAGAASLLPPAPRKPNPDVTAAGAECNATAGAAEPAAAPLPDKKEKLLPLPPLLAAKVSDAGAAADEPPTFRPARRSAPPGAATAPADGDDTKANPVAAAGGGARAPPNKSPSEACSARR